ERATRVRHSVARPSARRSIAACAIVVLPFVSQVKNGMTSPTADHAIKSEVTFCVRGVVSPLLANIYLHYVFDLWAERWRRQEATGDTIIVRYADDLVAGFEREGDARRFLDAMRSGLRSSRCRSIRKRLV